MICFYCSVDRVHRGHLGGLNFFFGFGRKFAQMVSLNFMSIGEFSM
jgi:hypothetical protein